MITSFDEKSSQQIITSIPPSVLEALNEMHVQRGIARGLIAANAFPNGITEHVEEDWRAYARSVFYPEFSCKHIGREIYLSGKGYYYFIDDGYRVNLNAGRFDYPTAKGLYVEYESGGGAYPYYFSEKIESIRKDIEDGRVKRKI